MKSKFTQEEVNAVMEARGISRKSALKLLNKDAKSRKTKSAAAPAVDVKQKAANDKPEATPASTMTPEERGKARAEGLRLFTLAGRPKKSDFIKVYGKRGHLMTWTQRAEAGIPAEKFQAALKKVR